MPTEEETIKKPRTAAAMVTFQPDEMVLHRISAIAQQVDLFVLVDNSHLPADLGVLPANATLLHNGNRNGLAGALNLAIDEATLTGAEYLFLFDQDTDVDSRYCESMLSAAKQIGNEHAGVFGPRHVNASTGHPLRLSIPNGLLMSRWPEENAVPFECMFVINSGSLLFISRILNARYDPKFPIDMSDVDFCLRLRRRRIVSYCLPHQVAVHAIGNRRVGSHQFSATNYSASRKRLQWNARVLFWRRALLAFPHFVLVDFIIAILDALRTLLFESHKLQKAAAMLLGAKQGFSEPAGRI